MSAMADHRSSKNLESSRTLIGLLSNLPDDREVIGGKALNLKSIDAMGFDVPPTAVIPTVAYCTYVCPRGLSAEDIVAKIESLKLDEFNKTVQDFILAHFGRVPLAIRSSANFEDRDDQSFSGQYCSFVDVTVDEIENSIKEIWKSLHGDQVRTYREVSDDLPLMAVIIQPFIRGSVSGVTFSANPVTANPFELVFNYVEGDCSRVTDGDSTAKTLVLDMARKGRREVLAEPFETVRSLASRFQQPVDIEWTMDGAQRVYILQVRKVVLKNRYRVNGEVSRQFRLRFPETFSTLGRDLEFQRNRIYNKVVRSLVNPRYKNRFLFLHSRFYFRKENSRLAHSRLTLLLNILRSCWYFPSYAYYKWKVRSKPRALPRGQAVKGLTSLISEYLQCYSASIYIGYLYNLLASGLVRYTRGKTGKSPTLLYNVLNGATSVVHVRDRRLQQLAERFQPCAESNWLEEQTEEFQKFYLSYCEEFGYIFSDSHPRDPFSGHNAHLAYALITNFTFRQSRNSNLELLKEIERELTCRPWGTVHRHLFRILRRTFQYLAPIKEDRNHLFYSYVRKIRSYIEDHSAELLDELGLESLDDLYFLTIRELESGAWKPSLLRQRKGHYFLSRTWIDPHPFTEQALTAGDRRTMAGLPCSVGRGKGPVIFVRSREDILRVRKGDILVTDNVRPFWTSVIGMCNGLVASTGNLLSHGASIAREYQVPAVFGLGESVFQLKEGEVVEIDGSTGEIIPVETS